MKNFIRVCIAFMLVCFILTGCVEKKDESIKTSSEKKYLVYDIGEISENLYSMKNKSVKNNELLNMLFSGLVREDYNTMEINPGLADKWSLSPNKLQYTFHIREGLKWSDGDDLTAQDVYDFFKQILSSKNNKLYAYDLNCIYGVNGYVNGKTSFDGVAISAEDNNTFQIRLNSPCDYFLKKLAQPIYNIRKTNGDLKNWTRNYAKLKYSGPYIIDKISNNTALLKKNNNFFSKDEVKKEEFKVKYHYNEKDVSAYSTTDFENSKNIDAFSNPPLSEVNKLKDKGEIDVFKTWRTEGLYFNMNNLSIGSDINFRKAITYLVDRNKILKSLSTDILTSENTFVPYELFKAGKCEDVFKQPNINLALQCIDKTNYASGKKIVLIYKDNQIEREMCENFVNEVNDTLEEQNRNKLNFDIRGYDEKALNDAIKKGRYDIYLGDYNIWYNSAVSFFDMWDSKSPLNINYKNVNYDDYIYSLHNTDGDSDNILKKMEEQLVNDLPVVPLALKNDVVCRKMQLKGLKENKYGELIVNSLR
ncbi:peptide ABC transporter substrate-binding protein [Clostridium acetobutylicum]|nr:peptide ABC transporter substrate-binding protein [Clostridium acetobutylicum]